MTTVGTMTTNADVVFSGGPVLTMDGNSGRAEAVAVWDGRIAAVGSAQELQGLIRPATEVVDLDGRALLPGFVDPHMHSAMVQMADWVDLSPMARPTSEAVFQALRDAPAASTGWVLAQQFDPSITSGHPQLDREVLDRLVPDRPLLVMESNGHIAYANSRAMERAGIDRDTPDPDAGRYVRDSTGELTGRLEESSAVAPFMRGVPMAAGADLVGKIQDLLWDAAATGATLLHDCSIGAIDGASDIDVLRQAIGEDSPVRYRGMLVSNRYDEWSEAGLRPGFGDDLFRVSGMKAWSDGSNQAATGFQREPYLGTSSRGSLNYSPEALADVVGRAHRDGWQLGVHANGDAAIDVAIDAFEAALSGSSRADARHRLEHCSVLHPEQIERMAALGLSPSFLIGHVRWWGAAFRDRLLRAERSAFYDPCASALGAGLRISLHSDWNVTPIEPLRYLQDAVTRVMLENGEVLNAAERIPVVAALRAITINAAWQCHADNVTGSIEVGKYADLVVLEHDPTVVDPGSIADIAVSETRLAGRKRFDGHR